MAALSILGRKIALPVAWSLESMGRGWEAPDERSLGPGRWKGDKRVGLKRIEAELEKRQRLERPEGGRVAAARELLTGSVSER